MNVRRAILLAVLLGPACSSPTKGQPSTSASHSDAQSGTEITVDTIGSNGSNDTSTGPITSMVLGFQPLDLGSDMATTPVRLLIDNAGNPVSDAVLDEAAAALQVHTLAGESIPFTFTKYSPTAQVPTTNCPKPCDAGTGPVPATEKAYVELSFKLTDKTWYELSLSKLPAGTAVQQTTYFAPVNKLKWGIAGVRFNPSSAPVLYELGVCTKGDGKVTAQLKLSEPVEPKVAAKIGVSAPGLTCQLAGSLGPSPTLGYVCQGTGKAQGTWTVKLGPDTVAMSGLPVQVGPLDGSAESSVDLSQVVEAAGCRYYRW